jgi:heptosyltransferase-3
MVLLPNNHIMAHPAPPLSQDVKRVMVIKLRQLGDVVLSTPVFRVLRDYYPKAELMGCVNAGTEEALLGDPLVDRVVVVRRMDRRLGWFNRLRQVTGYLQEISSFRPDLVIDLTANDRAAFLTWLSRGRWRVSYLKHQGLGAKNRLFTHVAQPNLKDHMVLQQLEALRAIGIIPRDTALSFPVSAGDRGVVAELTAGVGPLVHVHPVSRLEAKCWPDENMARLLELLGQRGLTPVLTASSVPVERDRVQRLVALAKTRCLDLSGKITIRQLGALSQQAKCFVGVDSAPMHIAAAVGTPVIGLFGPSSEYLWHPWCKKHLVLSQELPCRLPCKYKRTCTTYECLTTLSPDMVTPKVQAFLDGFR